MVGAQVELEILLNRFCVGIGSCWGGQSSRIMDVVLFIAWGFAAAGVGKAAESWTWCCLLHGDLQLLGWAKQQNHGRGAVGCMGICSCWGGQSSRIMDVVLLVAGQGPLCSEVAGAGRVAEPLGPHRTRTLGIYL